jgi:uncharacterized membrane protein YkvA (DUF1232 family)
MANAQETIDAVMRLVDLYPATVATVMDALTDEQTPAPARRVLASVLNYVLDLIDIFPDHYAGFGVADDAMLLRLGAKKAVAAGATQSTLHELADEAHKVEEILGELAAPLDKYVDTLAARTVRGRTVDQILGDKLTFEKFSADIQRQISSYKPKPLDTSLSADYHLGELRLMTKAALKKAGLL